MIANLLPFAFLLFQPVPGTAEPAPAAQAVQLTAQQQGALRCSAAFALVAERQRVGDPAALEFPPMGARGREFFVQVGARLMEEAGLTREAMAARMRVEADAILAEDALDTVMPPCLMLLEASGL